MLACWHGMEVSAHNSFVLLILSLNKNVQLRIQIGINLYNLPIIISSDVQQTKLNTTNKLHQVISQTKLNSV